MLDNTVSLISNTIGLCLNDKYKKVIIQAKNPINKKSAQLQNIMKTIKEIENKDNQLRKYLDNLKEILGKAKITSKVLSNKTKIKVVSTSKVKSTSKKKILEELEEHLGLFEEANSDLRVAKDVASKLENLFKGNRKADTAFKSAKALIKKTEETLELAKKRMAEFAEKQTPNQLTEENPVIESTFEYIEKEIENYKKENPKAKIEPSIDTEESIYLIDNIGKNATILRFARYIPLYNLPTVSSNSKDLYLLFMIDMYKPVQKRNTLVPEKLSDLMFTVTTDIVPPSKTPKTKAVASLSDVSDNLEILSGTYGLELFGFKIKGNVDKHIEKVRDKLQVLGNSNIKVEAKNQFLLVTIPDTLLVKGVVDTQLDSVIYQDLILILGLPTKASLLSYNKERLKKEKSRKNKNGSVTITYRFIRTREDNLTNPVDLREKFEKRDIKQEELEKDITPSLKKDITKIQDTDDTDIWI